MIIETLLSLTISHATPQITYPVLFQASTSSVYAKSYGSSSFRSSSSSSFRSSSSSSFRSSPSSSFRSPTPRPSISVPRTSSPTPIRISTPSPAPKIFTPPPAPKVPSSDTVRINKQITPAPKTISAPPIKSTIPSQKTKTVSRNPVVTRETYIERYNDSGIMSNPWFWMYMFDNNRQQVPTQVMVKDSKGENVTIPESQMIVRKYSYDPLREFAVFSLGSGIGIFISRLFKF